MSKAECNRAYLKHRRALEASLRIPKVSHVSEIFKRKPYSATPLKKRENGDERGRSDE